MSFRGHSTKLRNAILAGGIVALLAFSAFAQTTPSGQTTPQSGAAAGNSALEELKSGIIVEKVEKNFEGEKAGLKEGDVLLSWSRGEAKGELVSPFDLMAIEVEQAPRGTVTIQGRRSNEQQSWTLGEYPWFVETRPVLPQNLSALYLEGQELAKAGKVHEAAKRWLAAGAIAQKTSPAWLSIWFYFHSAQTLTTAQHWAEADDAYQKAVQQAIEIQLLTIEAESLKAWGASYQQRGDYSKAALCDREVLAIQHTIAPESLSLASSLIYIGSVSLHRGDQGKAKEYYRQALAIIEKIAPGSLAYAMGLTGLGSVALQHGDAATAQIYFLRAQAIQDKLAPLSYNNLINLGSAYFEQDDLSTAQEYYSKAVANAKYFPSESSLVPGLIGLGTIAREHWDLVKAEQYYLRALDLRHSLLPSSPFIARTLNCLGIVAERRGDLNSAKKYFRQGLVLNEKISPHSVALAMNFDDLGVVAEKEGNLVEADVYYHRAQALLEDVAPKSIDMTTVLYDLGTLTQNRGDLAKAETYFLQALQIAEEQAPGDIDSAEAMNRLGDIFQNRGDLAKAEQYYRHAQVVSEKEAPESEDHAESLAGLAAIMRRRHQTDAATQFYERALNTIESQTARLGGTEDIRSSFRAKYANYYKDYADLLIAQKKPDLAFQVLERLHARSMLETLQAGHADIRKGVDPALAEKEHSLQESINTKSNRRMQLLGDKKNDDRIAAFDKEINDLLAQYRDVEEQIRATSPNYAALTQPQPITVKEVQQQLLAPDTLLLEYSLGEKRSYVFAVTPDSLNAYELPRSAEIERLARRAYELLSQRNRASQGKSAQQRMLAARAEAEYSRTINQLSRVILGPPSAQLQQKRLLVVSDGALQYIPFSALPAPETLDSTRPVPLVAEHEIVNLPSASVLAVLRREEMERKPAANEVAVIADPVFGLKDERVSLSAINGGNPVEAHPSDPSGLSVESQSQSDLDRSAQQLGISGFPRLPFTRREAEAIDSIAGKNDAFEALDFEASKATALSSNLKDYRIVHFATHGLLNNEHPELSGLVFSLVDKQGNQQDGFLHMLDIYNMDLNADLVVLSACQTALGKDIGEEGLVGLTRGFMYAGAPRVVASLWKVDDEATAELMKKFYEGMLRDHQTPAQALRGAQQWMRTQKAWQSPYYWAGFVLQGEWR
ncbi:MAG TPA: CHAT domain-containing protein [Terriglobales bacterium]|jgi:CHAT domain-containing protein/Tfp pilus assembly protein PilF|nr:CHAT domain-containing protein [Terriglobales bacterium]